MTITEPSSSRTLSIENAVVTIRAIRVDNKPMTVSVYNQMPAVHVDGCDLGKHTDLQLLGVVNREHAGCDDPCTHVFATKAGEPVVLHVRSRAREMRWAADAAEGYARTYRPGSPGGSTPIWAKPLEKQMPPRPRPRGREEWSADVEEWTRQCRAILTPHANQLGAEARALADLDDRMHTERIAPLPQVYVAA